MYPVLVRLLVQAGYLIQSVLYLVGSIGPDTARKLSLKSALLVQAGISSVCLVQAVFRSAWKSRTSNTEVLVGTSRFISVW